LAFLYDRSLEGGGREEMELPESVREDLSKAIVILKEAGCTEIYLFGSFAGASTEPTESSDIDIAVRGLPKERFFAVYGKLLTSLETDVDLVALDYDSAFGEYLSRSGTLQRVA